MFYKGFKAVLFRELRRVFTTKDLLLLCFAAPLGYGLVLSSVYYSKRVEQIPLAVVDQDNTRLSRELTRYVSASQNISLKGGMSAFGARDAVNNGEISGFIYIPEGFSSEIKRGKDSLELISINATNFLVSNPLIQSLSEISNTVSLGAFADTMMKRGVPKNKAVFLAQPVSADINTFYNPCLNYSDFFLIGFLSVVLQQIILIGLGYSVADDREHNREAELLELSGGHQAAILAGKSIPYVITNFFWGLFYLFILLPVYGITLKSALLPALFFMFLFVMAVTSFGIMISTFFRNVLMSLIFLMFFSMPAFLISGLTWPLFAMPVPLRILSGMLPSTYFLDAFRAIILGRHPAAYLAGPALILAAYSVICWAITYLLFRHIFNKKTLSSSPNSHEII
jgi:ABC-2 type transport system permease protein